MGEAEVVYTPHGFTSRTSQPAVALATSDVANGAVFLFQCGPRRSLSHVHQAALGLGIFGLGKIDEAKKSALRGLFIEEARWVVTGHATSGPAADPAAEVRTIKAHRDFAKLGIHVFYDKHLDESNGRAWTIIVRALEREFAPSAAGGGKKKGGGGGGAVVRVYTSPARVPKAPEARGWLVFDGTTTGAGETGRLVPAEPEARREVEPYYSLACYVDVLSLISIARAHSPEAAQHHAVEQLRLYDDGWLRDDLARRVKLADLTQASEQIAHSPQGDDLFEEIHGRESLLSHLAHWDGFEKDAIYSQGHQCDHDHGDGHDHHHHHGRGHVHGLQPTRVPRQLALWKWLTGGTNAAAADLGAAAPQAAKKKNKRKKKRNKNKSAASGAPAEDAGTPQPSSTDGEAQVSAQ